MLVLGNVALSLMASALLFFLHGVSHAGCPQGSTLTAYLCRGFGYSCYMRAMRRNLGLLPPTSCMYSNAFKEDRNVVVLCDVWRSSPGLCHTAVTLWDHDMNRCRQSRPCPCRVLTRAEVPLGDVCLPRQVFRGSLHQVFFGHCRPEGPSHTGCVWVGLRLCCIFRIWRRAVASAIPCGMGDGCGLTPELTVNGVIPILEVTEAMPCIDTSGRA